MLKRKYAFKDITQLFAVERHIRSYGIKNKIK
jgi:hypothetical protein